MRERADKCTMTELCYSTWPTNGSVVVGGGGVNVWNDFTKSETNTETICETDRKSQHQVSIDQHS